jgi:hypothetical protein
MNLYQSLNLALFVGAVVALIGGLAKISTAITERPLTLWLFVAFFALLRLKMFLDDHKYFGNAKTNKVHFKIGFIIGFVSWLLWVYGAWSVPVLPDAYFLVGVAITASTIWIVVTALRIGAYREQYIWIATNALFVLMLWIAYRHRTPEDNWITWLAIGIGILLVILDFIFSKSVPELET